MCCIKQFAMVLLIMQGRDCLKEGESQLKQLSLSGCVCDTWSNCCSLNLCAKQHGVSYMISRFHIDLILSYVFA